MAVKCASIHTPARFQLTIWAVCQKGTKKLVARHCVAAQHIVTVVRCLQRKEAKVVARNVKFHEPRNSR